MLNRVPSAFICTRGIPSLQHTSRTSHMSPYGRSGNRGPYGGGGRGRGAYYANKYGRGRGRGRGGPSASDAYSSPNPSSSQSIAENTPSDPTEYRYQGGLQELADFLHRADHGPYPRYKDLIGEWELMGGVSLYFDRIQSDPYAPPSRATVRVSFRTARFESELYEGAVRRVAFCDFLTRKFWSAVHGEGMDVGRGGGGWSGPKGGDLNVDKPSQHVLERTSCLLTKDAIELRFTVNLPARGRSIEGRQAAQLLTNNLVGVVKRALFRDAADVAQLRAHVVSVEEQEDLRSRVLGEMGLIGFVADGAVLPRKSGAEDEPMTGDAVVKFKTPDNLALEVELKTGRRVRGMAIRPGISLIVGGGFHGKSTLLAALEVGVYNHIPGDGREFVCVDSTTMSVRAEDGRSVTGVNITPFINNLPFGKKTDCFSTPDASGSTSQAANIIEALEAGARVLLTDEDLAATNFMMRDERMKMLVPEAKEPITPMIDRIRSLYEEEGVSSILVVGGAGDYFEVSDMVVMMDCYVPKDVTKQSKIIAEKFPKRESPGLKRGVFKKRRPRKVTRDSLRRVYSGGRGRSVAKVKGIIEFGAGEVDLSAVRQLVETSQTRAIAAALEKMGGMPKLESMGVTECVNEIMMDVNNRGCDGFTRRGERVGNLARPRAVEVQAALNRVRGIEIAK
eukprot:GFKZ01003003.1.p1 GENE.GFKZ01003003.1~~GFKZ01003003.1.p1  ORF type:complete len:677 (-),score=90.76 GFKZ01003003.1:1653-3683(-)